MHKGLRMNNKNTSKRLNCVLKRLNSYKKQSLSVLKRLNLRLKTVLKRLKKHNETVLILPPPYRGANYDAECSTFSAEISGGRS